MPHKIVPAVADLRWHIQVPDGVNLVFTTLGVPGPPGPPGSAVSGFTHTQSTPASVWTINHNLGFRPSVQVRNSGGLVVGAEILHASLNQVQVTFTSAQAGTAQLGV